MKRDDLFTTLHDQYNTFTYTLQDPEAFHHDVYEIARDADTAEEFHRFLADRRRQRLEELQESLESLAVEIIANPKLIGTDQWQHALQLFRTKSFDSIVRYFASYLPDDYMDRHGSESIYSSASSYSEADSTHTTSTKASSAVDATTPLYLDDDFFPNGPVMTVEPCCFDESDHIPLSPPHSEATLSDESEARSYTSINSPSRSMSFSGSESGRLDNDYMRHSHMQDDDDDLSQSDDCDTAVTSVCDSAETRSSYDPTDDIVGSKELPVHILDDEEDDEFPTAQYPEDDFCSLDHFDTPDSFTNADNDTLDSDTPTPRPVHESTCYVEYASTVARKLSTPQQRSLLRRSPSPRSYLAHRSEGHLRRDISRRSPEETLCRVQKPVADSSWKRSRETRWMA